MSETKSETAECRGCRRKLRGNPYYMGGQAFDPITGERARVNHFGGFVCSPACDRRASLTQLSDMPGAGEAKRLDCYTQKSFDNYWRST